MALYETITEDGERRIKFNFHRGQLEAWDSEQRFTFVISGTQGGKTCFGPWWLYREIYGPDGCGDGDYLAVTASYDLFKLKMLPETRIVFEDLCEVGRWWAGDKVMELKDPVTGEFHAKRADDPMWGRIVLRSASAGGELESSTAKAAWLDECGQDDFTLEDWEAVQRRLSLAQGRVLGTTTPYNLGWLKGEIQDAWEDGDPDINVVNFPSTLNPAFPQAEYDRMQAKMQDWRFNMFYNGLFTRPAGLIYGEFTSAMLVDAFDIPDAWTRYVGIDFGGANNAILWGAECPDDGRIYLYDEWLGGGMTAQDYADKMRENLPGDNYYAWGGSHGESQARRDWATGNVWIDEPAVSEVEQGIDRGTQIIKEDRLRAFRTLKGFRDEIGSYRRKLDDAGSPLEEIVDKRRFHRMDAYRYMAVGIIEQAGPWAAII